MAQQALKGVTLLSHTYIQLSSGCTDAGSLRHPAETSVLHQTQLAWGHSSLQRKDTLQLPAYTWAALNSPKGESLVGASWKVKHLESKLQVLYEHLTSICSMGKTDMINYRLRDQSNLRTSFHSFQVLQFCTLKYQLKADILSYTRSFLVLQNTEASACIFLIATYWHFTY